MRGNGAFLASTFIGSFFRFSRKKPILHKNSMDISTYKLVLSGTLLQLQNI